MKSIWFPTGLDKSYFNLIPPTVWPSCKPLTILFARFSFNLLNVVCKISSATFPSLL